MEQPAQVLMIVLPTGSDLSSSVMQNLSELIKSALPTGAHLDIWPLSEGSSLLSMVRRVNCRLLPEP
jgi:hypothetical protein